MKRAILTWGEDQQVVKAIEEMSELIQALAKWTNRKVEGPGFDGYRNCLPIYEEMADVSIMMYQPGQIFGTSKLEAFIDAKMEKLSGYLDHANGVHTP